MNNDEFVTEEEKAAKCVDVNQAERTYNETSDNNLVKSIWGDRWLELKNSKLASIISNCTSLQVALSGFSEANPLSIEESTWLIKFGKLDRIAKQKI